MKHDTFIQILGMYQLPESIVSEVKRLQEIEKDYDWLLSGKRESYIWNHALHPEEHERGNTVAEVVRNIRTTDGG